MPAPRWMAWALAGLICFAVLTDAAEATGHRWAVSVFQAGVFALGLLWAVRPMAVTGSALIWPLGFAVAWSALQLTTGWTVYRFATWEGLLGWTTNLMVFFLTLQVSSDGETRRQMRMFLMWFGFAIAVVAAPAFFTSEGKVFWLFKTPYPDAVLGPFVSRDHYATFVALVMPFALYKALTTKERGLAYSAVAGAMFASVIAGASRAGAILVTAEVGLLVLPAVFGRAERRSAAGLAVKLVLFAAVFTAVVGWEVLWERFKDPDPYQFRREMAQSGTAMVKARPWTGFGMRTWPLVYPEYALLDRAVIVNHAHNDWVEWAGDGGLPFLAAMLFVFGWTAFYAVRFPWGAGAAVALLHSLVDFPMQKTSISVVLFAVMGLMAGAAAEVRGRRRKARGAHEDAGR